MKYWTPSIWPRALYSSGTASQLVSLAGVDLGHEPLVDVELLPAGVEVEDVGLAAGLHLGQDVGVGRAVLPLQGDLRIGLGEVGPEVLDLIAGPFEDEQLLGLFTAEQIAPAQDQGGRRGTDGQQGTA